MEEKIWDYNVWLGVASCVSFSQILGFFDHQNMCKESINTIYFLHEDNHQLKKGSESTAFSWVLPVVPLI